MFKMRFRSKAAPQDSVALPASDPTELPRDLVLSLENASVFMRSGGVEGEARAILQLDGRAGWVHSPDETKAQLLKRWRLTDAQLDRAVRLAGSLVRRAHRDTDQRREGWVRNW